METLYSGSPSPFVSCPNKAATMLNPAKHVITAVAWLNAPFSDPASKPATSGPKLVITRPEPLQNDTAVARTWVGNSSGKYTACPENTPNTKKPNTNSRNGYGPNVSTARYRVNPTTRVPML